MNTKNLKINLAKKLAAGLSCAMVFSGSFNFTFGTNLIAYAQDPIEKTVLISQDVQVLMKDPNVFFEGPNGMTFKIPNRFTEIGEKAFYCCHNISEIIIPNSITKIGLGAFFYCSKLERTYIPDSVTEIGDSAFSLCIRLKKVNIPDSITKLGICAFQNCTRLKRIKIPSSINKIPCSTFSGYLSLTEIGIPNNIMEIDNESFYCCKDLEKVRFLETENSNQTNLPNFVIGEKAFSESGVRKINGVPGHTVNVGTGAFENCPNFRSIEFLGEKVTLGENFINQCDNFQVATFPNAEELQMGNIGSSNTNPVLLLPPTCKIINKNS